MNRIKALTDQVSNLRIELSSIKQELANVLEIWDETKAEDLKTLVHHVYMRINPEVIQLRNIVIEGATLVKVKACRYNKVKVSDFAGKLKNKQITFARGFYILFCLDYKLRDRNLLIQDINRDRTMINHFQTMYKTDAKFNEEYNNFKNSLLENV